jgi:SSS family solute:Na+ symporter
MTLDAIDWTIIVGFLAVTLAVGLAVTKRAGRSSADFFLAGRGMPWWLLGMSMVATTFSAGTPNFVTDVVRQQGVAGNWIWWAFLLTGMMTVFVYAKLWRRSGVMTDLEFYELRYSGRPAAFLRGFRAVYLGVLFNVIVLASANLAAIKIAGAMLGTTPVQTILVAGLVTAIYSMLGGLTGVLITDFLLFVVAMGGAIAAAVYLVNLDCVGGLSSLLAHDAVRGKLSMFPDWKDPELVVSVLVIPLAVQWWSVWYPGAEPGGGGYVAQRMLAAKNEMHATGATLLFNVAHYALRPWPWILVALSSIIVFPDLASLRSAFPHMPEAVVQHDLAYPAMMTLLPSGLRGLVLPGQRLLQAVRPAGGVGEGTGAGRTDRHALDHGGCGGRRAVPEQRLAGVSPDSPGRGGHRAVVPPPLVLVANQRLQRNRRDGRLLRRGRLAGVLRTGSAARLGQDRRGRRRHHDRLAAGYADHPAH